MRFIGENIQSEEGETYLVQVPAARGKVIPEMASISDDLPALCDPRTAMEGMSRSEEALWEDDEKVEVGGARPSGRNSHPIA